MTELAIPWGPLPISAWRRLHLPRRLREAARISPGDLVEVTADRNDPGAVRITAVASTKVGEMIPPVRDSVRPRTVTQTGQISIPAKVLAAAGLSLADRVYLALDEKNRGIRLLPADRVTTIHPARLGPVGRAT